MEIKGLNNLNENKTFLKDSKENDLDISKGNIEVKEESIYYNSYKKKEIEEALREQKKQQIKNFEKLISSIFEKQSQKYKISISKNFKDLGEAIASLDVDEEVVNKAKSAISEDGYYGIEQTAQRILNFAKAIAGEDLEKLKIMREAVEKGFKNVEKIWGGEIPEISKKTYERVMETFNKWEEENI